MTEPTKPSAARERLIRTLAFCEDQVRVAAEHLQNPSVDSIFWYVASSANETGVIQFRTMVLFEMLEWLNLGLRIGAFQLAPEAATIAHSALDVYTTQQEARNINDHDWSLSLKTRLALEATVPRSTSFDYIFEDNAESRRSVRWLDEFRLATRREEEARPSIGLSLLDLAANVQVFDQYLLRAVEDLTINQQIQLYLLYWASVSEWDANLNLVKDEIDRSDSPNPPIGRNINWSTRTRRVSASGAAWAYAESRLSQDSFFTYQSPAAWRSRTPWQVPPRLDLDNVPDYVFRRATLFATLRQDIDRARGELGRRAKRWQVALLADLRVRLERAEQF